MYFALDDILPLIFYGFHSAAEDERPRKLNKKPTGHLVTISGPKPKPTLLEMIGSPRQMPVNAPSTRMKAQRTSREMVETTWSSRRAPHAVKWGLAVRWVNDASRITCARYKDTAIAEGPVIMACGSKISVRTLLLARGPKKIAKKLNSQAMLIEYYFVLFCTVYKAQFGSGILHIDKIGKLSGTRTSGEMDDQAKIFVRTPI
ncbi:hypothetical protein B0H10DRAFT_2184085 [Mycena sp. CBHHK59/15]|nr:hypothetical protein B0H10DRAFT_2184085 [Mycena sp. CBHHK59/15]